MTARHRVRLVVCGEPARGDDAAAFAALDRLDRDVLDAADIRRVGTLDAADLLDLPSDAACVVADAVVGIPPGNVFVAPLDELANEHGGPAPRSTHTLPLREVLALVAALRGDVPTGSFVGLGASRFDFGSPLSTQVQEGLADFATAINDEIRMRCAQMAGGG